MMPPINDVQLEKILLEPVLSLQKSCLVSQRWKKVSLNAAKSEVKNLFSSDLLCRFSNLRERNELILSFLRQAEGAVSIERSGRLFNVVVLAKYLRLADRARKVVDITQRFWLLLIVQQKLGSWAAHYSDYPLRVLADTSEELNSRNLSKIFDLTETIQDNSLRQKAFGCIARKLIETGRICEAQGYTQYASSTEQQILYRDIVIANLDRDYSGDYHRAVTCCHRISDKAIRLQLDLHFNHYLEKTYPKALK